MIHSSPTNMMIMLIFINMMMILMMLMIKWNKMYYKLKIKKTNFNKFI